LVRIEIADHNAISNVDLRKRERVGGPGAIDGLQMNRYALIASASDIGHVRIRAYGIAGIEARSVARTPYGIAAQELRIVVFAYTGLLSGVIGE